MISKVIKILTKELYLKKQMQLNILEDNKKKFDLILIKQTIHLFDLKDIKKILSLFICQFRTCGGIILILTLDTKR